MLSRIHISFIILFSFTIIYGCAHVISEDVRAKIDPAIAFKEVQQDPNQYKGKTILWGGVILQSLPENDGTTLLEVLQWPLSWRGEPQRSVTFEGKFLILVKENLDPSPYEKGKRVTVAGEIQGEIQGEEKKSLTDTTYRYPLVLSKQMHIWKAYYPFSSGPPYDPDPHWYNPLFA